MQKCIVLGLLLIAIARSAYEPELLVTVKPQFLNKVIANYSTNVTNAINTYPIPDPSPFQETVSGVKVSVTLKKIKQKVDIHWVTNIIEVKDKHTFKINSKNINITLDADLEAKVGFFRKQKGPLKITITKLEVDTTILFDNPKCPKSLGFNIQIQDVFVNAKDVIIKIEGKDFDNMIINQVQKLIKPRIPGLLQKTITQQVNPLISNYSCTRIEQQVNIKDKYYMVVLNTTEVPAFDADLKYLKLPVDITFQNLITNQTNNQLEDDRLAPSDLSNLYDVSVSASSNFLNTVIWLVGDAELLNIDVTNAMLGDNPPILLNTTNLTILLPNIKTKQWANKEVFLLITPSTHFEHLLIRSGRIVTVLSLSVKFVVNVTGNIANATECIEKQKCVVACDLNMTLPLSLAMRMNQTGIVGLLHSVSFYDIKVINSKIDVNVANLKSILNSIVGSMIPSLNKELVHGMEVPDALKDILEKYRISHVKMQTFQDFIGLGITIDL